MNDEAEDKFEDNTDKTFSDLKNQDQGIEKPNGRKEVKTKQKYFPY